MGQEIKVSILVPFYKVEHYVGRCVESLFTQTYKNIEYVFVNDCSPDKSMEVINELIDKFDMASKCKIIVHETNLGISASRNDCLDNMTGDFFLFIDSDDYIDLDFYEKLYNRAIETNADLVKTQRKNIDYEGNIIAIGAPSIPVSSCLSFLVNSEYCCCLVAKSCPTLLQHQGL